MSAVGATIQRESPHHEPRVQPLVQDWMTFIRAMEDRYAAPVRHTPAEVLATATWATRVGAHPPAGPPRCSS